MEQLGRRAAARARREAQQQQQQPVAAGADHVGRRAERRAEREAQAAQQPAVPAEPQATNLVPPEVHLSVWNRGNDNGEPRKVTGLPAKAPPEEATIYRFESAHKSGNDMVDALNRELIDLFNQTGNGRREVLSLLDQPKSSEVSKGIERWGRALDALRLKVGLKREQIVAAGGTPIAIPGHFKKFPKLLKA